MKKYIYREDEYILINHLINNRPDKIWYNLISYIFDYGSYYLSLDCDILAAYSQNDYDEAIIVGLSRSDVKFKPTKNSAIICENQDISNIYVARTFLYFSTFHNYSKAEKLKNQIAHKINNIIGKKDKVLNNIFSTTTGIGGEFICHPKSEIVKKTTYGNILDVGLLIETNGKYLKAFVEGNSFGFDIWDEKYFFEQEELKDQKKIFDFIQVKNNA